MHELTMSERRRSENLILEWLSPVDVQGDQDAAQSLHVEGTGSWIFEDSTYTTWLTTPRSLLWLHGHSTFPNDV